LVVSEYRERKILKRFQVTPVSPIKLLAVELSIYMIYSLVSMITLISVSMIFWEVTIHGSWLAFLGSWLLTMMSTLSIGMMVGGFAKKFEDCKRHCLRIVFSDVNFLRNNTSF